MAARFVFFDVGNTLLFADHSRTLAPLLEAGFQPQAGQLYAAERAAKRRMDISIESRLPGQPVDGDYWSIYYSLLLDALQAPASLIPSLVAATRRSSNWNQLRPGTKETLQAIRESGRRLGVISNSDGHIEDLVRSVGLGECFDSFTDSALVGSEKPDAGIFQHALASLGAPAGESIYLGDVYSVDYLGAKRVGMGAVLMDVAGAYSDAGFPRVESLEEFRLSAI